MTNFIQRTFQTIRRKLGFPETSVLVMGDNLPATRNRVLLMRSNTSLNEFIIDSCLNELPYTEKLKFKPKQFIPFEGIIYLIDATKEEMIELPKKLSIRDELLQMKNKELVAIIEKNKWSLKGKRLNKNQLVDLIIQESMA